MVVLHYLIKLKEIIQVCVVNFIVNIINNAIGIPSSQCHNIKDVFRTHFADLTSLVSVSIHRLSIAPKLYSARLISEQCFYEVVDSSSKSDAEKGLALMIALNASIHSQPSLFKTLVTILKKVEAFVPLAEKLRHDLYNK